MQRIFMQSVPIDGTFNSLFPTFRFLISKLLRLFLFAHLFPSFFGCLFFLLPLRKAWNFGRQKRQIVHMDTLSFIMNY